MITALFPDAGRSASSASSTPTTSPSASPSASPAEALDGASMPSVNRPGIRSQIASAAGVVASAAGVALDSTGSAVYHFLKAFAEGPSAGRGGGTSSKETSEDKNQNSAKSSDNTKNAATKTEERRLNPDSFTGRKREEDGAGRSAISPDQTAHNTRSGSAGGRAFEEQEVAISLATSQAAAGVSSTSSTTTGTSPGAANQRLAGPSADIGAGISGGTAAASADSRLSTGMDASAGLTSDSEQPIELATRAA